MISEESCDTEDWSNYAKKKFSSSTTEINYIFKYIQIEKVICTNISQYYCFYCMFDEIHAW